MINGNSVFYNMNDVFIPLYQHKKQMQIDECAKVIPFHCCLDLPETYYDADFNSVQASKSPPE